MILKPVAVSVVPLAVPPAPPGLPAPLARPPPPALCGAPRPPGLAHFRAFHIDGGFDPVRLGRCSFFFVGFGAPRAPQAWFSPRSAVAAVAAVGRMPQKEGAAARRRAAHRI